MSDIRIETSDGFYGNEDAYNNVIGYISKKIYWVGYGFYCGPDISVIEQFKAICAVPEPPVKGFTKSQIHYKTGGHYDRNPSVSYL